MEDQGTQLQEKKPTVRLSGEDGNVFAIIAACLRAGKRAGWDVARVRAVQREMLGAKAYDEVLQIALRHFEVE